MPTPAGYPHTIADYTNTFRKFQDFLSNDPPINEITVDQVRQLMPAQDHISFRHTFAINFLT
jgi:hypothetical protein